jgi:type II restriction/modification system DNA methylase subunit YeeA
VSSYLQQTYDKVEYSQIPIKPKISKASLISEKKPVKKLKKIGSFDTGGSFGKSNNEENTVINAKPSDSESSSK